MSDQLISISTASELTGLSDSNIRNKINEETLTKYIGENGQYLVNKREVLNLVPTILTVFNQKGGCGKTSLSVLLSDYYEKKKTKVLLVDMDQQMSLSKTYFDYPELKDSPSLYNYFEHRTPVSKIVKPYSEYVDIIPSEIALGNKDVYDLDDMDPFRKDFSTIFKKYQVVILDCPPAKNSFSKFALLMSNYILLPFVPEPYNYDGVVEALKSINKLKRYIYNFIDFKVVTSAHKHRVIQNDYINLLKEQIPNNFTENTIPDFVGIVERSQSFDNIFNNYDDKNNSMKKVISVLDEIDKYIYDERGVTVG